MFNLRKKIFKKHSKILFPPQKPRRNTAEVRCDSPGAEVKGYANL